MFTGDRNDLPLQKALIVKTYKRKYIAALVILSQAFTYFRVCQSQIIISFTRYITFFGNVEFYLSFEAWYTNMLDANFAFCLKITCVTTFVLQCNISIEFEATISKF